MARLWSALLAAIVLLLGAGQVPGVVGQAIQNGTSFQSFFVEQLLTNPSWVAAVRACFPNATASVSVPSLREGISLACMWDDPDTVASFLNSMLMANGSVTATICEQSQTPTFGSLPILMSTIGWPVGLMLGALDSPSLAFKNVVSSVYVPQMATSISEELSVCGNPVGDGGGGSSGGGGGNGGSGGSTTSDLTAEVSRSATPGNSTGDLGSGLDTSLPQVTIGIADDSGAQYLKGLSLEDNGHWEQKAFGRQDAQTGKPTGPLFPRTHMLLYYRDDWFKQLNVTPPATWEELISLGYALSNLPGFARTQFDYAADYFTDDLYDTAAPPGSGGTQAPARPPASAEVNVPPPDATTMIRRPGWDLERWPAAGSVPSTATQVFVGPYNLLGDDILRHRMPLCLDARLYCKAGDMLAAVAASIMQTEGGDQSSYIDFDSLTPLIANRGFQHALGLVHYMLLLATPRSPVAFPGSTAYSPTVACAAASRLFSAGACAMTIDWDVAFPFFTNLVPGGPAPSLAGNIGVAPLPGSRRVWDRSTDTLLACNATLCPRASNELAYSYSSPVLDLHLDQSSSSSSSESSSGDIIDPNLMEDPKVAAGPSSSSGELDRSGFPLYPTLNATSLRVAGVNRSWARGIRINRAPYSANLRMLLRVCRAENLTSEALNLLQQATDPLLQTQAAMSEVLRRAYSMWLNGSHGAPPSPPSSPPAAVPLSSAPAAKLRRLVGVLGADSIRSMHPADASEAIGDGQVLMGRIPPTARARMLQQAAGSPAVPAKPNDTSFVFDASWQLLQNWTQAAAFGSGVTGKGAPMQLATDAADSKRFFDALWRARMGYGNQAAQPILTDTISRYWRQAYEEALTVIMEVSNATSTTVVQGLQRRLEAVLTLEPGGEEAIKAVLHPAAAYKSKGKGGTRQDTQQASGASSINLAAAIASPIGVVAAVALIALVTLWYARRVQHRTLRGSVVPPGPGPSTTLVVTDIQDSTTCWEAVKAEIMDEAVGLHHATIRRVALAHAGYESATEGDSFILAFHTARDAALFAVSAQEALLHVEWPEEILQLPVCKEVWVAPVAGGKRNLRQSLSAVGASSSEPESDLGAAAAVDGRHSWLPQFLRPRRPSGSGARWLHRWSSRSSHSAGAGSIKQHVRAWHDMNGAARVSRPSATFGWGSSRASVDQPLTFDTVLTTPGHNIAWSAFEWGLVEHTHSPTHAGQQQAKGPGAAITRPPTSSSLTGAVGPAQSEAVRTPCAHHHVAVDALSLPVTCSDAGVFETPGTNGGLVQPRVSVGGTPGIAARADGSREGDAAAAKDAAYFTHITGCGTESLTSAASDMVVWEQLLRAAPVVQGPGTGRVLLFRGLRVRMGMASGVSTSELNTNAALGRVAFSGRIAAAAKAVQDCAQGGMVLCGPDTYTQLSLESLRPQLLALSMGEHVVKKSGDSKEPLLFPQQQRVAAAAVQLYQLLPTRLMHRAAHLGPVRSVVQRGLGALGAPYGHAAVVFMGVVGHGTLAAHDAQMTAAAVALYQEAAQAALYAHGGYLLEAVDGLCLAAFSRPASAIRWSLDVLHTCLTQVAWPAQLLAHELGEEVVATSIIPAEPMVLTPTGLVPARTIGAGQNGHGMRDVPDSSTGPHHAASTPATPHAAVRPKSNCGLGAGGLPAGTALPTKAKPFGLPQAVAGGRRASTGALVAASGPSLTGGARVAALHTTQLLFRGLRLRVGIDWGPIKADINAVSARVTCRGKVMNRAARIGATAKSGQVWVSEGAWSVAHADVNMGVGLPAGQAASSRPQSGLLSDAAPNSQQLSSAQNLRASIDGSGTAVQMGSVDVVTQGGSTDVIREVIATPLGAFKLKGITDEMSLVRVLYVD